MGQGYSSNARLFAKRGDPWVSRKEGIKDFGRNPETEDAEFDFDHRFHKTGSAFGKPKPAEPRKVHKDPEPEPRTEADWSVRRANFLRAMHSRINARKPREYK
jgi:hypothetical protein